MSLCESRRAISHLSNAWWLCLLCVITFLLPSISCFPFYRLSNLFRLFFISYFLFWLFHVLPSIHSFRIFLFFPSGFESKAAYVLRTDVMQYLLTRITALTIIQKNVRGFLTQRRFLARHRMIGISACRIQGFFYVGNARKFAKNLRMQQVRNIDCPVTILDPFNPFLALF